MRFPELKGNAVLAPMAGVNDVAFRALAKKYGAGLTYTGLTSSMALVKNKENVDRLKIEAKARPVAVQLFGSSAEEIVSATQEVQDYFDIIDLNCGCPAVKVTKSGSGSALMKEPDKIAEIVAKMVDVANKPVTIKIRLGPSLGHYNAVEVARMVEQAGVSAIAVHGRTKNQSYKMPANWDIIKKVKEAVSIPVIGSGDVATPEQFAQRMDESRVDYIMIGRAAMKNPYLFRQINDYLKKGKYEQKDKLAMIGEYIVLAEKYAVNYVLIKNNIIQLTKGMVGGAKLRLQLSRSRTLEELRNVIKL